ncbi:LysR family transcriptional regulator [Erwinia sp. CPCC 100877]|nr:LysR family transcriptional regulator [Erwinia sp. CPCC 100877]
MVDYTLNLKLRTDKPFFGPGVVELLQRIKCAGSLNIAAKEMKMSYNKAWRIIHYAEKELGFPLIIRNIGGSNGGGSEVTSDGERMIAKFLLFQNKTYQAANQYFEEIFGKDFSARK